MLPLLPPPLSAFAVGHVLLSILPYFVFAWSRYEQPIRLDKENGLQWELRIEHLLTMSAKREHGELSIHDFVPHNMAWLEREKNQLRECMENRTLLAFGHGGNDSLASAEEWAHQTELTLPDLVQFNGRHQRIWGINGQMPGPALVVPHGAEVTLRVKNRLLLESVSLHLHGMELKDQWYHGGVAPIQQCPLPVRSDFAFRFRAHPPGTHWYHGHFPGGHQSNGLLGALVVVPEQGMKEDRDFVAILQDWPLVSTEEQEQNWADGIISENGKGKVAMDDDDDGVWAILVNQKGWHDREEIVQRPNRIPWSRFPVGKDEQIRLRLIHGGFRHPLIVHIERHPMEVVAADGTDVELKKADALILYPGERFDVRIHTLRQPSRSIYRVVVGLAEQFLSPPTNDTIHGPVYGLAELEYGNGVGGKEVGGKNGLQKVDFRMAKCMSRQCALLGCPFQQMNNFTIKKDKRQFACIPFEELKRAEVRMDEEDGNGRRMGVEKHVISIDPLAKTVDDFHFEMPQPGFGLFFLNGTDEKALKMANSCSECAAKPCKCFYHKRFRKGARIQITFVHKSNNGSAAIDSLISLFRQSFSIHLHGTKFEVLKIGLPSVDLDGIVQRNAELEKCLVGGKCAEFAADFDAETGQNMQKDTVLVPYGGYTIIRFDADNPGWWLAETGQNGRGSVKFAFVIGNEEEMAKPPKGFPSDCGLFEPGDGVYGQFH